MSTFKIKCDLPSGKRVYVRELNNENYIALHKFVLNEDYLEFYNLLDSLIIKDFEEELSIYDKFYVYLSIYIYSIKSSLELESNSLDSFMMGNTEKIFLSESLDKFVKIGNKTYFLTLQSKIGEIKIEYSLPTLFEIVNEKIVFNPISAIKKIFKDDISYSVSTQKNYKEIEEYIFTPENYYKLIKDICNNFNIKIIIAENKIELSILNYATYEYFAKNFFCSNLKYIYDCMYLCSTELRIPPTDFKELTPIESEILIVNYINKRKEEEQQREKANGHQNEIEL